jgi:hypothetical protein
MNMAKPRDTDPPQPPPFQRKIVIAPVQAVGLSVLCLIVAAALAGLLGQRPGETQASNEGLEVRVSYPEVLRYKTAMPLEINVRNAGSATLNRIDVHIARDYLEAFQDVRLTPDAREISERHFTVSLADLRAGQSRKVVAWLEAHERGRRRAQLQVAADSRPALELDWSTTVLP